MKLSGPGVGQFYSGERVLIVEVNWVGDVLFSTPAIRAIRKIHPGAYIAALVVPRCKEILLGNNYLDEVIVLDEDGCYKGLPGALRLIRDLRMRRFEIVYFFHRSFSRTLCCFLAGIKKRIGYYTKKRGFLLTGKIIYPSGPYHRADIYHHVVTGTKIPKEERYCNFFVSNEDKVYIDHLLQDRKIEKNKKLVVLHVGGNWDLKLWPKEHFADLIGRLVELYGVNIVISGTPKDLSCAQEIAGLSSYKPVILCGMTTLKQLGVLFQKSDLVVSADSGPLHIALAVKAKVIALFGPTSPGITGPLGLGDYSALLNKDISCVIPCYHLACRDNICMSSLTPDMVLKEVEKQGWLLSRA